MHMHEIGGTYLGWFIWLAVIVGLVALVVWAARSSTKRRGGAHSEMLDRRYARGEITREQYEQMKNDLCYAGTPLEALDRRYARGEITREQYELMKKDLSDKRRAVSCQP